MNAEGYCTTREAAQLLGVSLRTAQLWVERGRLEAYKTAGGHRRISRRSVDDLLLTLRPAEVVRSLSVLVVEDDASLQRLYRMRMERWPFPVKVAVAPNAFQGLVMVGEMRPDILICDLRLPGINGFQMIRALSALERYDNMSIVAVSGMSAEEIEAHGGLPPWVQRIGKPVDFGRLEALGRDRLELAAAA